MVTISWLPHLEKEKAPLAGICVQGGLYNIIMIGCVSTPIGVSLMVQFLLFRSSTEGKTKSV